MLPYGSKAALKTLNYRVPEGTPPDLCHVANEALVRLCDVMDQGVRSEDAGHVLKAAQVIRHEVCGPLTQKIEHTGKVTFEQLVLESYGEAPKGDSGKAA